jgi:hypothetical protein
MVGKLHSIKGKHGYYHIITSTLGSDVPDFIYTIESITIQGVEYQVQNGVFFITPEPVEYFKIGEHFLHVE